MQARISGDVELKLTVDPATGSVSDVNVISGHPLLKPAAMEAARQWRLKPNSIPSGTVNAILNFELRCP